MAALFLFRKNKMAATKLSGDYMEPNKEGLAKTKATQKNGTIESSFETKRM